MQWPIRYCCISNDGTLLAVAGRNGLVHYSSNTGRWKMFTSETEETSFSVRGGMVWYYHVLIVATESARGTEVSLQSRSIIVALADIVVLAAPTVFARSGTGRRQMLERSATPAYGGHHDAAGLDAARIDE